MILEWRQLALDLQAELKQKVARTFSSKKYVAIIFLWDDYSSATYVRHKKQYGENIGLPVIVFGQNQNVEFDRNQTGKFDDVGIYINQKYDSIGKVIELIKYLNYDDSCVGIIVQLPLPEQFKQYKTQILCAITPTKDVDGLGGVLTGLSSIGLIDFVPATPKAVLYLLDKYGLGDMKGKTVAIIGQSIIVGRPLIIDCVKRWATVASFNQSNSIEEIKKMCKSSDYIISCTGKVHFVDESFVRDDKTQIIVDVWYGHKDGNPVGDVILENIIDKVAAYTPVPGGIWPLTVACLFTNVFVLQGYKEILKPYKL